MTDNLNPVEQLQALVVLYDKCLLDDCSFGVKVRDLLPKLRAIVQAEREACAHICESHAIMHGSEHDFEMEVEAKTLCTAIRSRGDSDALKEAQKRWETKGRLVMLDELLADEHLSSGTGPVYVSFDTLKRLRREGGKHEADS